MTALISNQNVFDIAIQENGNIYTCFEIALANNISITDSLSPISNIDVPISINRNNDLINYFSGKGQKIATSDSITEFERSSGIGFMQIENNLKVS